jgi:hypothetical protein
MNCLDTLRQLPPAGREGGCLLIGLLVGFGEEAHGSVARSRVFLHLDDELDFAPGWRFFMEEK